MLGGKLLASRLSWILLGILLDVIASSTLVVSATNLAVLPQASRAAYPASAVARIVGTGSICTAVLIDKYKAVTARHCVVAISKFDSGTYIGLPIRQGNDFYSDVYLEFLDASEQPINVPIYGLKLGDPENEDADWAILHLSEEVTGWPPSNISPIPLNSDDQAFTVDDLKIIAYGFDSSVYEAHQKLAADFECTMKKKNAAVDTVEHTCGIASGASGGPILTYPCDSDICTDVDETYTLLGIHSSTFGKEKADRTKRLIPILSFRDQLSSPSPPTIIASVRVEMGKYQLTLDADNKATSVIKVETNPPQVSFWYFVQSESDLPGYFYLRNHGTKDFISSEKDISMQSNYKVESSGTRTALWTLYQPSSNQEDYCMQSVATLKFIMLKGKNVVMTKSCNKKNFIVMKKDDNTEYTSQLAATTTPTVAPTTSVTSKTVILQNSFSSSIFDASFSGNGKKQTSTFTVTSLGDVVEATSLFSMTSTSTSLPIVSLQNLGTGYYLSAIENKKSVELDLLQSFEKSSSEWLVKGYSEGDFWCLQSVKYEGYYLTASPTNQLDNFCGKSNGVLIKQRTVVYEELEIPNARNNTEYGVTSEVEDFESCDELDCISQSVCTCDTTDCHPNLTTTIDCFEHDATEIRKIRAYTNLQSLTLGGIGLQTSDVEYIFQGHYENLQFLDISGNEIISLPDVFVENVPSLQSFQLVGNDLRALPTDIGDLSKLEILNMDSNRIEKLPSSVTNLASLSSLSMASNRISMVPDGFGYLTNLITVDLLGNQITSLDNVKSFTNLKSLTYLNLDGNSLTSLPQDFTKISSLRLLSLSENELEQLPSSLSGLSQLTSLSLSGNKLTELPNSMTHLTGLTSIDVSINKLTSLPSGIGKLTNLRRLYAQGSTADSCTSCSTLQELPDSMSNLSKLLHFDLRKSLKQLKNNPMPSVIAKLSALTYLDMGNNGLVSVPDSLTALTNLTYISLRGNEISELPSGFGALSRLQGLDLKVNDLTTLPDSFGNLTYLQYMSVASNPLTSLPETLGEMTELTGLYLWNTRGALKELPDSVTNLQKLRRLTLSRNSQLSSLDFLSKLTNLDFLNIARNEYTSIPSQVAKLTNLGYLVVEGNSLTQLDLSTLTGLTTLKAPNNANLMELPDSLTLLTNLAFLDVSESGISKFPEKMDKLTALTYLDLSQNSLASLPAVICELPSLTQLDVSSNQITTLSNNLGNLGSLRRADFSSNSLVALPKSISGLTSLTNLNLQGNTGLTSMPTGIWTLSSLQSLDVSGCSGITSIPNAISGLTALTELDLGSCNVTKVPNGLGLLSNLKTLDLRSNNLSKLPASMSGLSAMVNLNVRSNLITAIDEAVFEGMPRLTSLNLERNDMSSLPSSLTNLMNLESFNLLPANNFCGTYPVWNYTIPDIDYKFGASKNC